MSRFLLSLLLLFAFSPAGAEGAPVEITHWPVEWADTRPRDPAVAADGRVWFVETHPDPNRLVGFDADSAAKDCS